MNRPAEHRPPGDEADWPRLRVLLPFIVVLAVVWGGTMFVLHRFLLDRDASGSDLAADAVWRTLLFFVLVSGLVLCDRGWRKRRVKTAAKDSAEPEPE